MNDTVKKYIFYTAPLAAYMALIYYLSMAPVPSEVPNFDGMDKVYHTIAYAVMGALMARLFLTRANAHPRVHRRLVFRATTVAFVFGVFVEISQGFTNYRSPEVLDAVANGVGAFIGAFSYWKLARMLTGRAQTDKTKEGRIP